jgi:hypothetical protein
VNGGGRCGDLIEDRLRMPEQFRAGLGTPAGQNFIKALRAREK